MGLQLHYLYIIKSEGHKKFYIGYTTEITRRIEEHNKGLTRSTKPYLPWKAVYLEGYANEQDAKEREKKIKQFGKVYSQLKRRIWRSLRS